MMDYLRGFYQRHRRKIWFAGTVAAGLYGVKKYFEWTLAEMQEAALAKHLGAARKRQHFESNQLTSDTTVKSLIPNMREEIMRRINTDEYTIKLRTKKLNADEKIKLWSELKIESFVRTMVGVYSVSILVVFLKLQMNVLSGYLYNQTQTNSTAVSTETQAKYLDLAQHIATDGVDSLGVALRPIVEYTVGHVSLKQEFAGENLFQVLTDIRARFDAQYERKMSQFILPSDALRSSSHAMSASNTTVSNGLRSLMDETLDALESPMCQAILRDCVNCCFDWMREDQGSVAYQSQPPRPLAKVIPSMTNEITVLLGASQSVVDVMLAQDSLLNFSKAIYDTFTLDDNGENR